MVRRETEARRAATHGTLTKAITPYRFGSSRLAGRKRSGRFGDLLVVHHLLKLASLEHLHHDIATADEFALHIELGNGRPVRIALDALADFHVLKDIDTVIGDTAMVEN